MENQLTISLSKNKLLKNVDILKINLFDIKGKLITVGEGEILYREGDPSDAIYLVVSGEINVIKKRLLGKTKSYIFIENDFFGHEEYFEETTRTSTSVALRDSYLISLSKSEIELLIDQDQQIYINLHEPVEEVEDDFTQYEKGMTVDGEGKPTLASTYNFDKLKPNEDKTPVEDTKENEKNDEEFFKSIADASVTDDSNVVQPLKNKQEPVEDEPEMISFTEDDEATGEEEIKSDNKLDELLLQPPDIPSLNEDIEEPESQFDESAFLNEDGIPKAEFEIPDKPAEQKPRKRQTKELDDALFKILSGESDIPQAGENKLEKETPQLEETEDNLFEKTDSFSDEIKEPKEEESSTIDDNSFFAAMEESFANSKMPAEDEIKLPKEDKSETDTVPFIEPEPFQYPELEPEIKPEPEKLEPEIVQQNKPDEEIKLPQEELSIEQPNSVKSDSEDILAEVEENLRKIDRGEPVEKSVNWRTLSDDGGEMNTTHLNMIIKAAELVNSTVKIDEVLSNIVEVATNLTNADRGTLYLIDREKNELWSMVAMGQDMKEIRLKIGEGIAGYVGLSGEVVNIKDVQHDPRFRGDFDRHSGYTTKNMICFPIKNNKAEIIGVLQLLNSKNGEFSKLDEDFLNAISIHSALAIQNAAMVEKLLASERVHSLGKMANFLIQDIKKPILVSKRYAEHLKTKSLAQDVNQVVEMLLDQLTQVADLVQTTSSYSEGKPMLRTLNVSLNSTLNDFASRIGTFTESRHCRILSQFDKDVTVKLDVKEFYQCYLHIVKNACDAMTEGGDIEITTKRDDRKVGIYFKDKGIGIPDGFKDKIFEPFMSYGKKEGTGLGLSITKKVVEAHNGTIEVHSSLGDGATFVVTLPVASAV